MHASLKTGERRPNVAFFHRLSIAGGINAACSNRNRKFRVYKRNRYGTSAVKKAEIKKANEASLRARELRRQSEMREDEPAEDLLTPNEVIETKLATPYEMRNRFEERGSETEPPVPTASSVSTCSNYRRDHFQI